jgi:hypothetical protein
MEVAEILWFQAADRVLIALDRPPIWVLVRIEEFTKATAGHGCGIVLGVGDPCQSLLA